VFVCKVSGGVIYDAKLICSIFTSSGLRGFKRGQRIEEDSRGSQRAQEDPRGLKRIPEGSRGSQRSPED